jgi:hypothetical protein
VTRKRDFEVNDIVYLFCPMKKARVSQKFRFFWKGLYRILSKLSDLNYRIVDSKWKETVVRVNWLKKLHDQNSLKVTVP